MRALVLPKAIFEPRDSKFCDRLDAGFRLGLKSLTTKPARVHRYELAAAMRACVVRRALLGNTRCEFYDRSSGAFRLGLMDRARTLLDNTARVSLWHWNGRQDEYHRGALKIDDKFGGSATDQYEAMFKVRILSQEWCSTLLVLVPAPPLVFIFHRPLVWSISVTSLPC